jgi:hypothetical protein
MCVFPRIDLPLSFVPDHTRDPVRLVVHGEQFVLVEFLDVAATPFHGDQ